MFGLCDMVGGWAWVEGTLTFKIISDKQELSQIQMFGLCDMVGGWAWVEGTFTLKIIIVGLINQDSQIKKDF